MSPWLVKGQYFIQRNSRISTNNHNNHTRSRSGTERDIIQLHHIFVAGTVRVTNTTRISWNVRRELVVGSNL